MDFIENTSPKYDQVRFLSQKNAKKRVKMHKETKLGEALRSASWHSNSVNWHLGSADWHKFQIGPRYA